MLANPSSAVIKVRAAFTLVELLLVIAIIVLLMALLLPALKTARGKAHIVECRGGLRQLAIGATSFAGDHNDRVPAYVTDGSGYTDGEYPGFDGLYYGYAWCGVFDAATAHHSAGTPSRCGNDIDQYFGYKFGVHYDRGGPIRGKNCIYFCYEVRQRWYGQPWYQSFGYGMNVAISAMNTGPVGWSPDPDFRGRGPVGMTTWGGGWYGPAEGWQSLRLSEINRPDFTIYMHDFNMPVYPSHVNGPDIWPLSRHTGLASPYVVECATIHLGGQNISFFDGHTEYVPWPGPAKCQIVPGYDYTTYCGADWSDTCP